VSRFLDAIRGDIHASNMYELITPGLLAAIRAKIKGGDFDYFIDHFGDLAKHYRPLPKPCRGVDGSIIIELKRLTDREGVTDLEAHGLPEKAPRMQVQHVGDDQHFAKRTGSPRALQRQHHAQHLQPPVAQCPRGHRRRDGPDARRLMLYGCCTNRGRPRPRRLDSYLRKEGVEPSCPCEHRFLRPTRIPFRHFRACP
jgi:hypothetical protein